jgi:hypothetical protein
LLERAATLISTIDNIILIIIILLNKRLKTIVNSFKG